MTIKEPHRAYDENYGKMLENIEGMGGDEKIPDHRRNMTALYQKLKELQKIEHRLSAIEEAREENT